MLLPRLPRDEVDLDHAVPFAAGGETSLDNAVPACRRHHNLRTHHHWQTGVDTSTGEITWTSPGLRTGTSRPPDWSPLDPLPPDQRSPWPVLPFESDGGCAGSDPPGPVEPRHHHPPLGPIDWDDPPF